MRFAMRVFFVLSVFAASTGGQSEQSDPYSIHFVESSLRTASTNPGVGISFIQKNLQRLGDGVSIALLKIVDDRGMADTKTVEASLSLIRDSFSYPPIISIDVNKEPKVTMFLLNYWKQSISDPQTIRDIQQTIQYVQHQTARSETP